MVKWRGSLEAFGIVRVCGMFLVSIAVLFIYPYVLCFCFLCFGVKWCVFTLFWNFLACTYYRGTVKGGYPVLFCIQPF